ncbi:hypothetical protein BV924_00925 [Pectobacterium odoriferum]|uniref:Uncharacterized protein n=1 Tax=Pectobacterium odoriferum TaxID=78398 RepID=A0ABD6VVT6_9GAMM|nr:MULTISPECIES: hypothetical protein [Pectobacterium]POE02714.1 hypothetical protein BVY05_06780 [Pectobacterium odoriferum]POE15750.1 hypothetical protein BV924_00925 [Pectobacterium odoriferum]POE29285.1 hypothetical protein BV926_00925 [Pectobacterium odoriferum]POE34636.1 hypothetical protein BV919_00925 [Pectobacterium odoriferum]
MLTNQAIKITNLITWGVSIFISIFLSSLAIWCDNQYIEIKQENIIGIATLLGTFSFTMTGFIAAIGAYIISVSDKKSFLKWKQKGYIYIFYHIYGQSIVFLLISFLTCMAAIITPFYLGLTILKCGVYLLILNIMHIILMTIITLGQMQKK